MNNNTTIYINVTCPDSNVVETHYEYNSINFKDVEAFDLAVRQALSDWRYRGVKAVASKKACKNWKLDRAVTMF